MSPTWNRLTSAYRLYWFYASPTKFVIRRTTRRFFATRPAQQRVLEVGGGTSMMKGTLERGCRPAQIVSSDIEPTGATDLVCDALALPFPDGRFDLVVAFEVMEHIADTHQFLAEACRVLGPGGHVMISVPFLFGVHDHQDFYRFTTQGLEKVFGDHGLRVTKVERSGGILFTTLTLFTEYIRTVGLPQAGGWRSRSRRRRIHLAATTVLAAPLMLVSWVAFGLDLVIDRNSRSPSGLVVIARLEAASVG